jgi:tRNA threonylcarbamoyladenosine biosynthesis protein TsaB
MITLGLDTSTARGALALLRDGKSLAEESFSRGDGKRPPEQHLFGALEKLMAVEKLSVKDIQLITVGLGPGSFTGIRVGIAAAKGLALPGRLPIKGVSSFDALALTALPRMPRDCPQICVLCDARHEEVYFALYDAGGNRVRDCAIAPLEEIAGEIHAPLWFVSPEIGKFAGPLKEIFGGFASVCPEPVYPSAAALGALGLRRFEQDGRRGDAVLEPIYLRQTDYKKL